MLIPPKALVVEQAVIQFLSRNAFNILSAGFKDRCLGIGVFVYDGRQNIGQIDHTQFIFQPAHGAVQQADLPICARLLPDIKHISRCKSAQYRTGPIRSLVQQHHSRPCKAC